MIQIALVGLGHAARHQIAAIDLTEGVNLTAACDIDPYRAAQLPRSVKFHTQFDELLSQGQFDVIMISTPNRERYRLALRALETSKALVLEKPAVETREQFDTVVSAAASGDVFLYVAMHAAFGVEVRWLSRQLRSKILRPGELRGFRALFHDPYITQRRLADGASSLGGSWMDSGVNALSVLGTFTDLQNLHVMASHMRAPGDLSCSETEALIELESDRVRGKIHTSWLTGQNRKSTRLFFENYEVLLDHSGQRIYKGAPGSRQIIYSNDKPSDRLTNHYIGVFSDLVTGFSSGSGNVDVAASVHRIFFEADEMRLWDLESAQTTDGFTAV